MYIYLHTYPYLLERERERDVRGVVGRRQYYTFKKTLEFIMRET